MQIATGDFQGALDSVQANIAETEREVFVNIFARDYASSQIATVRTNLINLNGQSAVVTVTTNRVTRESTYQVGSSYSSRNQTGVRPNVALAMGGIFDQATRATIGEDGLEVALPLTKPARLRELLSDARVFAPIAAAMSGGSGGGSSSAGGGAGVNLVVNAGLGTDGYMVGQQIVDALARYTRVNGPAGVQRLTAA